MEKITLKPIPKELLFKTEEDNTYFDVSSYHGASGQERALGSLFLVGHVTYGEEDLGYVISLISSLAKREYYSETALKSQDPKRAFEQTLKKLNEVLEDFFKNKTFNLSLGLTAIAGDQIYISKLGKFKVGLARSGDYIDVLNNVALFHKSEEDEQEFSNIISGKLQPGDKLFAYYPARAITSREKSLQSVFIKENQDFFGEKIAQLADTSETFSCCGLHIAMEQIKEIPLQSMPSYQTATPEPVATLAAEPTPISAPVPQVAHVDQTLANKPRVIAAELSVAKKDNAFSKMATAASSLRGLDRMPPHRKFRMFVIIAAIVLIPLIIFAVIKGTGESSEVKAAYKSAIESLTQAKARIAENKIRDARALLLEGLAKTDALPGKNIEMVRTDLQASLRDIDKVSSAIPTKIGALSAKQTEQVKEATKVLKLRGTVATVWYNGAEHLTVANQATEESETYALKDPVTAIDAALYESNLYTLLGNHIYKYSDALKGSTKRTDWGSDASADTLVAIAVDGNLYALTEKGDLVTYFKGEKKAQVTLPLSHIDDPQLTISTDGTSIYLTDRGAKRLMVLAIADGSLRATYKLDVVGEIKNTAINDDGSVWILAKDGSIWQLVLQ